MKVADCRDCGKPPRECGCDLRTGKTIHLKYGCSIEITPALPGRGTSVALSISDALQVNIKTLREMLPSLCAWRDRASTLKECQPFKLMAEARAQGHGPRKIAKNLNRRWDRLRGEGRALAVTHDIPLSSTREGSQAAAEMTWLGISLCEALVAVDQEGPFLDEFPVTRDQVRDKIRRDGKSGRAGRIIQS